MQESRIIIALLEYSALPNGMKRQGLRMKEVNFQSCVILDNQAWFITVDNCFMRMDINTGQTHFVMFKENVPFYNVINSMLVFGNQIYWVDQNGEKLRSYDVNSEICKAYEIKDIKQQNYIAFSLITKWKDTIILIPKYTDKILFFNIQEECFTEIRNIYKEYVHTDDSGYVEHAFSTDEHIFIFLADNQTVLKYSTNTGQISALDRKDLNRKIVSSYWHKNVLYVVNRDGSVWAVDEKFELVKDFSTSDHEFKGYSELLVADDKLILFPSTEKDIIMINIENGKREQLIVPDDLMYKDSKWSKYTGYMEQQDFFLVPNRISNYVLMINKNNFDVQWIKPFLADITEVAKYVAHSGEKIFKEDDLRLLVEYVRLDSN